MPRKLRLEYPGAVYHVINRGNYRADIFGSAGARLAFTSCLWAVCKKSGWRLHAYVLMRNHFHLAVETPKGNLVAGMQWLQATFANRFNRLRGERGHLFQGRYKALLVEPGAALGQLCHYIHLNPVRAGVVTVGRLKEYRDSSYWHLWRRQECPPCLGLETALRQAGGLADTLAGRRAYEKFLAWQAANGPAGRNQAYVSMSRGWVLGSQGFKEDLLKQYAPQPSSRAWETAGKGELQRLLWAQTLSACLHVLGKTPASAARDRKSAPWKIATAAYLKQATQANNRWLTEQLAMGSPVAVSHYVSAFSKTPGPAQNFFTILTTKLKT
jgi:REP element-mobilizing transposase RayT